MGKRRHAPMPVAIIDMGAHSVRLEIYQLQEDRKYHLLESIAQAVNIGKEVFSKGVISPDTISLVSALMKDFARKLREYGVECYEAVATSAVREALNREIFLDRVKSTSRIRLKVLEASEEARLLYLAIKNNLSGFCDLHEHDAMFLTLGTGTTGIAFAQKGQLLESEVFGFGSLRIYEEIGEAELNSRRIGGLMESFSKSLIQLMRRRQFDTEGNKRDNPPLFISIGAGVRMLAQLMEKDEAEPQVVLGIDELERCSRLLADTTQEELAKHLNVIDYVAKSAEPCCFLLRQMCRVAGCEKVIVPMVSTRQAIIEEMIRNIFNEEDVFAPDIISTAFATGEKYSNDNEHGYAVAETAVKIFDRTASIHRLDGHARLLLYLAGILHDIGSFIDARKHHKHSYYIILNSQIPGLSEDDMKVMAAVARYHRKASPRQSHPEYMILTTESKVMVSKLAAILRVADALDHSHHFKFKNADFRIDDCKFIIKCRQMVDCSIERIFLDFKSDMFYNVIGLEAVIE